MTFNLKRHHLLYFFFNFMALIISVIVESVLFEIVVGIV